MPMRLPRIASTLRTILPKSTTNSTLISSRTFITSTKLNASNRSLKSTVASFSTSSISRADAMTMGANAVADIDVSQNSFYRLFLIIFYVRRGAVQSEQCSLSYQQRDDYIALLSVSPQRI